MRESTVWHAGKLLAGPQLTTIWTAPILAVYSVISGRDPPHPRPVGGEGVLTGFEGGVV